ncbi:MAG: hypothetical protein L0Y60_12575 [Beijerinckiaceae bacterium]|nr:hypothetical protein [Beijerinckiaceae bacterium]
MQAQICTGQTSHEFIARRIGGAVKAADAIRLSSSIRAVSIAPLSGEAIARIAKDESVSRLFDCTVKVARRMLGLGEYSQLDLM